MNKNEQYDIKNLFCPKCNILEDTATVNTRESSTLVIVKSHSGPLNFQGYEFYSIICFKCKNITLIAIDPKNEKFFRFVEINKATELDISTAKMITRALGDTKTNERLDKFFDI